MVTFTAYLQQRKLLATTVRRYARDINYFLDWLKEEDITAAAFTYTELLDFMQSCTTAGISKRRLHARLGVVRHYCNYLIAEKQRTDNPAAGVFIRGIVRKKLPVNLLTTEEMEELYKQYSIQLNVDGSKKIMLGLMVYQGLTGSEIMRIHSHHIKLKDGNIFIKGTRRSNERTLQLNASQILQIEQYLKQNKFKEGAIFTEPKRKDVSNLNIRNRIQYMFDQLKKLNEKVINAMQIRNSVITLWLRQNNLRQVQYMAGHKYVSSTERYQTNNLDDLQNELQQHHPMK